MADSNISTEVAIVGGGLVGMAAALSLAKIGISTVLLEAQAIDEDHEDLFDDRTLVINPAAHQFWQSLGVWPAIEPFATEINHVHVSNQGQFGVVHFEKDELEVPQLGHVVAAKKLANVLLKAVKQEIKINHYQPASLQAFEATDDCIKLRVDKAGQTETVNAQLMLAADGVQSSVRNQLNLSTAIKSYQRSAIVCNVTTSQRHANRAYERLTQYGPMALLPYRNRFGFVWSMPTEQAAHWLKADKQDFIKEAQKQFGYRAGVFEKLGRRSSYPIYQIQVPTQYAQRTVLIGNAAHAVSPVSAQGLNLAVRGIKRISEQLHQSKQAGTDLGATSTLQAYQLASNEDQQRTLDYTDDLMTWFKIDEPVVNAVRSMGLVAINANIELKKSLYKTAGGLR